MIQKLHADALEAMGLVPDNVWSKLGALVEWVKKAAIEVGCEHKDDVIQAADQVIEYLVGLDIPQVPPVIEIFIDKKFESAAKAWVREEVAAICQ